MNIKQVPEVEERLSSSSLLPPLVALCLEFPAASQLHAAVLALADKALKTRDEGLWGAFTSPALITAIR